MNKLIVVSLVMIVFLTSGCATGKAWYHPNKTQAEIDADLYEAHYRAKSISNQEAGHYANAGSGGMGGSMAEGTMMGFVGASAYNREYANYMRSRGYRLVPRDRNK
ncbi:MAG: hypothetical protein Q8O13_05510 [Candidatus Omnitrophota bacterium]|nr:hypothetical protein [Candidatus Omnitrophota bacterium]